MKKFIFKDMTISEARLDFVKNINTEYQLRNGEVVTVIKVSEIKEMQLGYTDFGNHESIFPDGALAVDRMTKYKSFIGFEVRVSRKTKNGHEEWTEQIMVPLAKQTLETDYERSLIN